MPATTRTTSEQGKTVRLVINIKKNGVITDPYTIGTGVDIEDTTSTIVASGLTIVKQSDGVYYTEYPVAQDAPAGTWHDIWRGVVFDSGQSAVDLTENFYVQLSSWQGTTPDICRVYDFLSELDGDPLVGKDGTAKILNLPYSYGHAYYSNFADGLAYSDSSGKIQWDLVYGAKVNIKIPSVGINKNFLVPNLPTAQLQDIAAI